MVIVQKTPDKLKILREELKKTVLGREEIIDGLVLAIASSEHCMIEGVHGEAKTYLVKTLCDLTNLDSFFYQGHNESTVKDIIGILNPVDYQKGKLSLLKTDFWKANIIYIDEILRMRTECIDMMLEVMIERQFSKSIIGKQSLPVVSVIATTNPQTDFYNVERLDLAMKDRFSFIFNIKHLIEERPEILQKVLELDNGDYVVKSEHKVKKIEITRDELIELRKDAFENVKADAKFISDLFLKFKEQGFVFSARFVKRYMQICKINAYINSRKEVKEEDLLNVANLMLINRYEQLDKKKIEDTMDDVLILNTYKDTMDKIEKIRNSKENVEAFIENAVDILEETKADYPEFPKKMKETIDMLRKDVGEVVSSNLLSIKPTIMKKLDTEEFKHLIEEFIKTSRIETAYLMSDKVVMAENILKNVKFCKIFESPQGEYKKFIISPVLNKHASFTEIVKLKEDLQKAGILSRY